MGRIAHAVDEGACTVEEVSCATRASTGCGGCKAAVARIIEEHRGVTV
jgi:assimilatory nitrate reductase electron transfer subunit